MVFSMSIIVKLKSHDYCDIFYLKLSYYLIILYKKNIVQPLLTTVHSVVFS